MISKHDLFEDLTAREYLKLLAKNTKQMHDLATCNNILLAYTPLEVHISRGIEALAAAAGKEIKTTPRNCDIYPNKLQFKYKGVLFYQLHR